MKVIQELIAYFDRRGQLTPKQLVNLLRKGLLASAPAASLVYVGGRVGQTYYFRVHGEDQGRLWGTDVYTGDSMLASAAVHSGAIELGETGVVKVTVVEPLPQYRGSTRHSITS